MAAAEPDQQIPDSVQRQQDPRTLFVDPEPFSRCD